MATARMPMTSRPASGEGESLKALMIHCSFGRTSSRVRITAPENQFTTMRTRSTTNAIGSAADDEADFDIRFTIFMLSTNDNVFIVYRQVAYRRSITLRW